MTTPITLPLWLLALTWLAALMCAIPLGLVLANRMIAIYDKTARGIIHERVQRELRDVRRGEGIYKSN